MDRRDVLKVGLGAGLGALGGCAPPRPAIEPGVMPPDMHGFLSDLDARMEAMNSADFVRNFAATTVKRPLTEAQKAGLEPKEKLFRGMLRTLYLTQTFRDLPEEAQLHEGMQERMRQHLPEVDRTVTDVTGLLSDLDDEQRMKLQVHLRAQPNLGMMIGEAIDEQAAIAGVSGKRRLQLRSMMMQTSFRFKHSPPGAVIDEYVEKTQRMIAQNGAQSGLALQMAGRAGNQLFWQQQGQPPVNGSGGNNDNEPTPPEPTPQPAQPAPFVPDPTAAPAKPKKAHPGVNVAKTGGILMGIGVVTFGVSAAVIAAGGVIPGLIGMTVGALLFAAGLITLIVGAIIYLATSDPDPE